MVLWTSVTLWLQRDRPAVLEDAFLGQVFTLELEVSSLGTEGLNELGNLIELFFGEGLFPEDAHVHLVGVRNHDRDSLDPRSSSLPHLELVPAVSEHRILRARISDSLESRHIVNANHVPPSFSGGHHNDSQT